ncbi:hypothetical protein SprV_0100182400 [Sparganum proliferum]
MTDRPKAELRDASVAFSIRNDIVGKLPCLSQGVNDRLLLRGAKFATTVSVIAQPTTSSDEVSTKFYEDLRTLLATVPNVGKLVSLGDFNARAGTGSAAWRRVLRPHEIGGRNGNGPLLLKTHTEHHHLLTNTFRLPTKVTWMDL